jgi:hypothetical protein
MEPDMVETQISLSEQELGLILSLLKQEQDELPSEMHHTHSSGYRAELHDRQALVKALVGRLEQHLTTPAT